MTLHDIHVNSSNNTSTVTVTVHYTPHTFLSKNINHVQLTMYMSSGQAAYDGVTDTAILVWMVANHVQLVNYYYQSQKHFQAKKCLDQDTD